MYKVIEKTIKFDRDMLVKTIIEDKKIDHSMIKGYDSFNEILIDSDIRPETMMILTKVNNYTSKAEAVNGFNKVISEFDFKKKLFDNDSAVIYISSVDLLECDFEGLALRYWDHLASCNEITGRRENLSL